MKKHFVLIAHILTGILAISIMVFLPILFDGATDNGVEKGQYLFFAIRFLLLLYIFFLLNHHFTNKLKYEGDFQKIMYKGVILSLIFTCYTSIGLYIKYLSTAQGEDFNFLPAWFVHAKEMVKVGLLYTLFMVVWIHFHPYNQVRLRKKAARLAKEKEAQTKESDQVN